MKERLSHFTYSFATGPLSRTKIAQPLQQGDCRTALQEYFIVFERRYFTRKQLLNPEGYLHTGTFAKEGNTPNFFNDLRQGAVIYAERTRNKHGVVIDCSPRAFASKDDYVIALHSAVFLGTIDAKTRTKLPANTPEYTEPVIWHATGITGESCIWPIQTFLDHYKPVAAKYF